MKALILNSGLGSRMGVLTSEHPKCMTEITARDTILSRQLRLIAEAGIEEVVMTTGYYDDVLVNYCESLDLPLHFTFVKNPVYDKQDYIVKINAQQEQIATLTKQNEFLQQQVNSLTEILIQMRKDKFGSKSEKTKVLSNQLNMINEPETFADPDTVGRMNSLTAFAKPSDAQSEVM